MKLSILKDICEIFESLVTGFAMIIGGIWAYRKFVRQRKDYPRVALQHRIIEKELNDKKKLIHLIVEVKNTGNVRLFIKYYDVRLNQVLPLSMDLKDKISNHEDPADEDWYEIFWPNIYMRKKTYDDEECFEMEPSEMEEFHFDFVIDKEITTIQIYSYFKNVRKAHEREVGWQCTTFHDLDNKIKIKK